MLKSREDLFCIFFKRVPFLLYHIAVLLYSEQVASGSNQEVKVKHEFELNYDEIGKDVIRGSQPKLLQIDYEDEDFAMAKPL